jgi:hypothetical protein
MLFSALRRRLVPVVVPALLLVSGCSGGESGTGLPQPGRVYGSLALVIPAKAGTSDVVRSTVRSGERRSFLSPSAMSVSIAVTGITPNVVADVSATSPDCTGTGPARTCTIALTALSGSNTFTVTLYDAAGATGNVLGVGKTTMSIAAGSPFTVAIPVNGTPGSIAVTTGTATFTAGTASSTSVTVTASDADNNVITGTYQNPITLTNSDATGAFTLSATSVTSSTQTITLHYSGSAAVTGSTIGASATGVPAGKVTPQIVSVSGSGGGPCSLTSSAHLYVANDGGGNALQFVPPYTAAPFTFPTGINHPVYAATDHLGNVFISEFDSAGGTSTSGDILEFTPPYTGAPLSIGLGQFAGPRGDAVDNNGNLFAADQGNNRVLEWAPPYTGTPASITAGPLNGPYSIALNAQCNLFVTSGNTVFEYAPPYTGTPVAITNNISGPDGVAFDPSDNLWVTNGSGGNLTEYAPPYTGAPIATITPPTGIGLGMAFDTAGNMFINDYGNSRIPEYAPPYTGSPIVTMTSDLFLPGMIAFGP